LGQAHLVIVGTSVLRNALRLLEQDRLGSCRGGDVASCRDALAYCADPRRLDRARCRELFGEECFELVYCLLESSPQGMSAELNAMDWVLGQGCPGVEEIVLFASDTPEGGIAARLLARYLSGSCPGARIETVTVPGLGSEFWTGLLNIVKRVREKAREAHRRGDIVYLNATGGFKPETGMALIAAMLAAPTAAYYKHEAMRETVMLPALPLGIDKGRLRLAKAQLLGVARSGETIRLDDPGYAEIQWILSYLAMTGLLVSRGQGYYTVTDKAAELLEILASIYDELEPGP